jgi:hypothetical protein
MPEGRASSKFTNDIEDLDIATPSVFRVVQNENARNHHGFLFFFAHPWVSCFSCRIDTGWSRSAIG